MNSSMTNILTYANPPSPRPAAAQEPMHRRPARAVAPNPLPPSRPRRTCRRPALAQPSIAEPVAAQSWPPKTCRRQALLVRSPTCILTRLSLTHTLPHARARAHARALIAVAGLATIYSKPLLLASSVRCRVCVRAPSSLPTNAPTHLLGTGQHPRPLRPVISRNLLHTRRRDSISIGSMRRSRQLRPRPPRA